MSKNDIPLKVQALATVPHPPNQLSHQRWGRYSGELTVSKAQGLTRQKGHWPLSPASQTSDWAEGRWGGGPAFPVAGSP